VALHAVAENLVEEDAGSAARENRRPHEGFGLGRFEQRGSVVGHAVDGRQQALVVGQAIRVDRLEGIEGAHVGAVGGFGGGGNDHARETASLHDARTFGIDEVLGVRLGRHRHMRGENAGVILKAGREFAHAVAPGLFVELHLRRRMDRDHRRLARKIVGIVGFGHAHLGVGLDPDEALGGQLVSPIGIQPHEALEGIDVVLERNEDPRREAARLGSPGAAHAVVVVELGRAHAHGNIENAIGSVAVGLQGAEGGGKGMHLRFGNFVAQEVRRRVRLVLESEEIAAQFLRHGVEQHRRLGRRKSGRGEKQK